jgi:hypothetical protein
MPIKKKTVAKPRNKIIGKKTIAEMPDWAKSTPAKKAAVKQWRAKMTRARKECVKNNDALAPLISAYEQRGTRGLLDALLPCLPLYESKWVELRKMLPPEAVRVTRGGHHIYGNTLEPTDFLPDAHVLIYIMNPKQILHSPNTPPDWVLCSFCGKPIPVQVVDGAVIDLLTNCPHVTPHIRGSGWIVNTIPLAPYFAIYYSE